MVPAEYASRLGYTKSNMHTTSGGRSRMPRPCAARRATHPRPFRTLTGGAAWCYT